MENRIKECQLDLFADRPSSHTMRAKQLRPGAGHQTSTTSLPPQKIQHQQPAG
jgi:hypothetical protein